MTVSTAVFRPQAARDTIIVSSTVGCLYSHDAGKTWRKSRGVGISSSVRYIGPIGAGDGKHFGIAARTAGGAGPHSEQ